MAGANADAGSLAVLSGLNIEQLKQTKEKSNLYCATLLNKILKKKNLNKIYNSSHEFKRTKKELKN